MSKIFRFLMILVFVSMSLPSTTAQAAVQPGDPEFCKLKGGIFGSTPDGSNFCLWLPVPPGVQYDGDLVIFAHGYVDALTPDGAIPWEQLVLTTPTLPEIVAGQLHTAFAITSYAHNGLAVVEGVTAVTQLATVLKTSPKLKIKNIYLVGASEGGLVTTQAIEQNPRNIFSGGVTTCGPIGDFKAQVNYWGDFRVAFDYFFQDFLTGLADPVWIQDSTRANWGVLNPTQSIDPTSLQGKIAYALATQPAATKALLSVGRAPIDPADPNTIFLTVLGILDYNVRATNQARMELSGNSDLDGSTNQGNPYGNKDRLFFGSGSWSSDLKLNQWIKANDSFTADPNALATIKSLYQTSGKIKVPLVAMHNTGDPIVPYWHEPMYFLKIWANGNMSKFFSIPINRYGHCNFTAKEAVFAYAVMVYKATGQLPTLALAPQSDANVLTLQEFKDMYKQYDLKPVYLPIISQ